MTSPTYTLSIPDCSLGASSPTLRTGTTRRDGPAGLRTIAAALANRSTAYRVEVLRVGWRSFLHAATGSTIPSVPLGEVRLVSACSGGVSVAAVGRDTNDGSLPSEVGCWRWCSSVTTTGIVRRFAWTLGLTPTASATLPATPRMMVPIIGRDIGSSSNLSVGDTSLIVLREGEGLAVYTPHNPGNGASRLDIANGPWSLNITVRVAATGATYDYIVPEVMAGYDTCAGAVLNGSGSGVVLEVVRITAHQVCSVVQGFAGTTPPPVGVFHARNGARMAVDLDGFVRDVSAGIVPHDSDRPLASGIVGLAGAMPFDMFVHGDQSALGYWVPTSTNVYEGGADPSSLGRLRRISPYTVPNRTALGPLHINGLGRAGDALVSRAGGARQVEPILLQPGEALGIGHAFPSPGLHGTETTLAAGAGFYIGDVEVLFRVLPLRGRPEVRAA